MIFDGLRSMPRLVCSLLLAAALLASTIVTSSCAGKVSSEQWYERTTSPLSGLPLSSSASAGLRALAVKIENAPEARPQSGLDRAEVVFEELVEGGITRFIALYLDGEASEIGPIRSARPMDADILECVDPLFAVSGGSPQVMQVIKDRAVDYVSEAIDKTADYFFRTRERRAPHNLYTSTSLLRSYCAQAGLEGHAWKEDLFSFGPPLEAEGCSSIKVAYPGSCSASYEYDAASGRYLRSVGGVPHLDKVSGKQLAPATVIIQYVELEDTGVRDVAGELSPDAVVVGSGEAIIFTGGRYYPCTWKKETASQRTLFLSEDGEEVPIEPGQVWIHLVPRSIRVIF